MISALGMLLTWGLSLFLLLGFIYCCSDENKTRRFIGKVSMWSLLTAVVSSVLRELLIAYN